MIVISRIWVKTDHNYIGKFERKLIINVPYKKEKNESWINTET